MSIHRPRLTRDMDLPREGHEFRYRLAAGFTKDCWVVDAACGTGYGALLLHGCKYYWGVDIDLGQLEVGNVYSRSFIEADLCVWQPVNSYDVFVSFETIEHLITYDNLVAIAKQAREWIIISAPIIPTKTWNHYHVHDFAPGDLEKLFVDDDWEHYQTVQQPSEKSEICVFRRRT